MDGLIIHRCNFLHKDDMIVIDEKNIIVGAATEIEEEKDDIELFAVPFGHRYWNPDD